MRRTRSLLMSLGITVSILPGCGDSKGEPILPPDGSALNAGGGQGGTQGGAGQAGSGQAGSGQAGSGQAGAAGLGGAGQGGGLPPPAPKASKVDLLFMVDNSASMADKQQVLSSAVPDLLRNLVSPPCVDGAGAIVSRPSSADEACPAASHRLFAPVVDMHVGVVTSSLGGHGADICQDVDKAAPNQTNQNNFTRDDRAHLVTRGPRADVTQVAFPTVDTYQQGGFLAWDAKGALSPVGLDDPAVLTESVRELVLGADQIGCGYEASLEAWYRFLVEPDPPAQIAAPPSVGDGAVITGTDTALLSQRAAFLRPDSLVVIVMLTDEDDCSIIDGAMPPGVCEDPQLDENGAVVGCKTAPVGWPKGYVEGNFANVKDAGGGKLTGDPFPANYLLAQQNNGGSKFHLKSGTSACQDDPYSPECSSCFIDSSEPVCASPLGAEADAPQLRCFDGKRRFGVDMLYPLARYVDGLTKPQIIDRHGALVPNPLFAGGRSPQDVIFTAVAGVPWQDLAQDPSDATKGYKTLGSLGQQVDWELVLGDPFNTDQAMRHLASDPLMHAGPSTRGGQLVTGETLGGPGTWNSINGHEWKPGNEDLQYACIFDLPQPRDCSGDSTSCDCGSLVQTQANPLCETVVDGVGTGQSTTTQRAAKAYPTPRILQVVHDVGSSGVLGSICAPQMTDPTRLDFGYHAVVDALLGRAGQRLAP